eukprot:3932839-Rhodomonas_salina.1
MSGMELPGAAHAGGKARLSLLPAPLPPAPDGRVHVLVFWRFQGLRFKTSQPVFLQLQGLFEKGLEALKGRKQQLRALSEASDHSHNSTNQRRMTLPAQRALSNGATEPGGGGEEAEVAPYAAPMPCPVLNYVA